MEIKHIPRETFLNMQRNWGVGGGASLLSSLFLLFVSAANGTTCKNGGEVLCLRL